MMIDNFLCSPRTFAEWLADSVRVAAVLLTLVLLVSLGIYEAGIMAFTLPGLMLPKFIGMRGSADLVCISIMLIAALSNIFGLYTAITGWDLIVHCVCTAIISAAAYLLLAHAKLLPFPSSVDYKVAHGLVFVTVLGVSLGAVWEVVEWIGFRFLPADVVVNYDDTITDLIADTLGSVVAGFVLSRLPILKPHVGVARSEQKVS